VIAVVDSPQYSSPSFHRVACLRDRSCTGFTLIELAVTISVAALLITIAVPSFSRLAASQRAKAAASELYASLLQTRAEAIMRNANVAVSPVAGGWSSGWQILDPANPANVLESHGAVGSATIVGPAGGVTYRPSGRVQAGVAPSFLITTMSGSSTNYQCISLNLSGRPYMQAASTC
jgi:type IV fimbrial biogenesis protein FimT